MRDYALYEAVFGADYGEHALQAAKAYNDLIIRTEGPRTVRGRSPFDVPGITRQVKEGGRYINYVATWREGNRRVRRTFACSKYGEVMAFKLALRARFEGLKRIHGKEAARVSTKLPPHGHRRAAVYDLMRGVG